MSNECQMNVRWMSNEYQMNQNDNSQQSIQIKQENSNEKSLSSNIDDLPVLPNVQIPQTQPIERSQRIIHNYKSSKPLTLYEQKNHQMKYPFAFDSNSIDYPTATGSSSENAMFVGNSNWTGHHMFYLANLLSGLYILSSLGWWT